MLSWPTCRLLAHGDVSTVAPRALVGLSRRGSGSPRRFCARARSARAEVLLLAALPLTDCGEIRQDVPEQAVSPGRPLEVLNSVVLSPRGIGLVGGLLPGLADAVSVRATVRAEAEPGPGSLSIRFVVGELAPISGRLAVSADAAPADVALVPGLRVGHQPPEHVRGQGHARRQVASRRRLPATAGELTRGLPRMLLFCAFRFIFGGESVLLFLPTRSRPTALAGRWMLRSWFAWRVVISLLLGLARSLRRGEKSTPHRCSQPAEVPEGRLPRL
ncbi:unnamed protein product [Prorocentrum cordatum]|uniref:Uncharacterized protein n=1 Tax=Prorocentrum cordatum TaxID=2364126 RepID=A0ABN9T816_9DINO|nr:unnamed protein product [Polarella glacialis]